jgi:hypothetical protein
MADPVGIRRPNLADLQEADDYADIVADLIEGQTCGERFTTDAAETRHVDNVHAARFQWLP